MTTAERIAEIRVRLASATPGPWERDSSKVISPNVRLAWCTDTEINLSILASSHRVQAVANAELIAHAPGDLEWATDEIERLNAELAAAQLEAIRQENAAYRVGSEDGYEEGLRANNG